MWKLIHPLIRWVRDERGATAVEYGLILALITIAVIGAVTTLADTTIAMWNDVSENVSGAS